MNSLPYFPLSITRTHPLASPSLSLTSPQPLSQGEGLRLCNIEIHTPFSLGAGAGG